MVVTSLYVITVLEEIKPVEVMSFMCVNNGCADLTPPAFFYFFICTGFHIIGLCTHFMNH